MLYKFKLGHNATKASKNICCILSEGVIDHSTITRGFKEFCLGCKNIVNQVRSGRPKTVDSEATFSVIENDPVSCTQRVSGELSISQSNMDHHLHHLGKSILPRITKILQNFWLFGWLFCFMVYQPFSVHLMLN